MAEKATALKDLQALATRTKTELDALKATVPSAAGDLGAYTKEETDAAINNKLSSVYKFKGSVAAYGDLPTAGNAVGDTYNVETASPANKVNAGDNVTWDGTAWDVLSGTVDLSAYATTEAMNTAISAAVKPANDKLANIAAGATKTEPSTTDGNIKINGEETAVVTFATDAEVAAMLTGVFGS